MENKEKSNSFAEAKKLLIAMFIGVIGTVLIEEYRLMRSEKEVQEVTEAKMDAIKFANRLDSLLTETHKSNLAMFEKYAKLETELSTVSGSNSDLTVEALEVVKIDSINILSETEFDSIRSTLREEYHVIQD